jgi:hypothetical protein
MSGAGSEMLVFAWVVLFPYKSQPPEDAQPFVPSVSTPLPQLAGL